MYYMVKQFTYEQEEKICEIIDEWYYNCKDDLVDWENKTHKFGMQCEKLKTIILSNIGCKKTKEFLETNHISELR